MKGFLWNKYKFENYCFYVEDFTALKTDKKDTDYNMIKVQITYD